jgi:dynein heavy chain
LTLFGDVLLISSFIVYLGPLPPTYRSKVIEKYKTRLTSYNVRYTEPFNLTDALSDPLQIRSWNLMGLMDLHSVENAILVKEGGKYPLMIDPQRQAYHWILNMEKVSKEQ